MKGVQCYELFGGIALKNHTFSFSFLLQKLVSLVHVCCNLYLAFKKVSMVYITVHTQCSVNDHNLLPPITVL